MTRNRRGWVLGRGLGGGGLVVGDVEFNVIAPGADSVIFVRCRELLKLQESAYSFCHLCYSKSRALPRVFSLFIRNSSSSSVFRIKKISEIGLNPDGQTYSSPCVTVFNKIVRRMNFRPRF